MSKFEQIKKIMNEYISDSDPVNTNNKTQKYTFINIFAIVIRHTIISYFIASNQYSNISRGLCNLMICSNSIKKLFAKNFYSRYMYYVYDIPDINRTKFA